MSNEEQNALPDDALTQEEEDVIDAVMAEEPEPDLSLAPYFDSPVKRRFIRIVEKGSGQKEIKSLYDQYRKELKDEVPFWEATVSLLDLNVQFNAARLAQMPMNGLGATAQRAVILAFQ